MTPKPQFKTMRELSTPEGRLLGVCDVLNAEKDTERGQELVKLLEEWMAAPSLAAMLQNNVEIGQDLQNAAKLSFFVPGKNHKYGRYQVTPDGPNVYDPHSFTVWMFANLVTNPLCERLAGPCARCGIFYIKKRMSQTVYCSRRCGNAATALARTRERIKAERKDKLRRAKTAIKEWRSAKTQEDWKHWVANRASVDLRFLTRAIKKGDLVPPTKGR
jgi:hypothetical protein